MENRKHPRKQFDRAVKCITPSVIFDCRGVNLSLGGICLRSPLGFEFGEGLALLIPVGNDTNGLVLALGKVVWMEQLNESLNEFPVCAGIQFLATAGRHLQKMAELCQTPD